MTTSSLPGEDLDVSKMPGHWALARLGKRVLRPGGLEMTRTMLDALRICTTDHVVEFAPGLGITARLALRFRPASYTAVESDATAKQLVENILTMPQQRCIHARAEHSGLSPSSATVVYAEALLTMQTLEQKKRMVKEAARLLKPGGRYGIHEICLVPQDLSYDKIQQIEHDMALAIRAGVRPLRVNEWVQLFEAAGLTIEREVTSPFNLLEPRRLIQDEGVLGAVRIAFNMLLDPAARKRALSMRRTMRRYSDHLQAIMILATKKQ